MTTLTPADRVQAALGWTLFRLPAAVQRLLAGGPPVQRDGQELLPEVQLALRLMALSGQGSFEGLPPADARRRIADTARVASAFAPAMARVEPVAIPGPAGTIPARLYVPTAAEGPQPLLVYFHGGGWVVCDLDTHDGACRFLAATAGVRVLSVDYRLAPEHRFPAAVDDAVAAFRFARDAAPRLGADPTRLAVGGDSAGGNLAAVVARETRADGGPRPRLQLLVYPVTDLSTKHASYRLFSEGFFLTERQMDWYRGHYLPDEAAARDPRASPLLAEDLHGLPPALVLTAGFDPLRDEGEAYAERLRTAGVPVTLERQKGLIHGFANTTGMSPASAAAMRGAAEALKRAVL